MEPARQEAVVIGAGPAGLMAAEALAARGIQVTIAEAKPSPARKFLMAGKSGLNLSKDEPPAVFEAAYGSAAAWLAPALSAFGPAEIVGWAQSLGQPVFTGSTGRIFPRAMKASPLLRAWLTRLASAGIRLRTRWHWQGWEGETLVFATPEGPRTLAPAVTVLAVGGASWARLGSDGAWAPLLAARGVDVAPFAPANFGLSVGWSEHMTRHFGTPLKAIALRAGDLVSRGEIVISTRGLEGGGLYPLSRPLRQGAPLTIDLVPGLPEAEVSGRLAARPGRETLANRLRKALAFDAARLALLQEFARPLPGDPAALARLVKALPVRHAGPRPMDEAISTAGGIRAAALDPGFMLKALPGTFAAGEMLDWEAPTGGYLLTACLATGRHAGQAAAAYALGRPA
jgi:uncharacterized flavoprotein (TIGR03862 family)